MSDDPRPIHEYRRYSVVAGKMPAVLARFEKGTFGFFEKHGIRCIAFWETLIGESNQIHYILEWSDLETRHRVWDALQTDPEWIAYKAATERDGPLVESIHNELWRPAHFSPPAMRSS